jgi:predicted RNA binding protein YcfA (HicA-like mRNA interferase family)
MRLPRDVIGTELVQLVKRYGYSVSRQTGSHIRLTMSITGAITDSVPKEHHITIPRHNPIRIGTLAAICADIAKHQQRRKEEIIDELFR